MPSIGVAFLLMKALIIKEIMDPIGKANEKVFIENMPKNSFQMARPTMPLTPPRIWTSIERTMRPKEKLSFTTGIIALNLTIPSH